MKYKNANVITASVKEIRGREIILIELLISLKIGGRERISEMTRIYVVLGIR